MPLDSFHLYEVPIPDEWRHTPGKKHITVALAFDPPVRRRRADYLGVKMDYLLIRGKTIEEIVAAYRSVEADERATAPGAFKSPYKCGLEPESQSLASSTLQRSSWSFMRPKEDHGDTCYLLVKAKRGWAPATVTEQNYAIAVSMSGDNPELRTLLEQRIRLRQQQRARMRQGR